MRPLAPVNERVATKQRTGTGDVRAYHIDGICRWGNGTCRTTRDTVRNTLQLGVLWRMITLHTCTTHLHVVVGHPDAAGP